VRFGKAYWYGNEQAHLAKGEIIASWGHEEHSETSRKFCNHAFRIFYLGRQQDLRLENRDHAGKIRRLLEDCGTTGWGSGVEDLQEAFEHFGENGGFWRDEETSLYQGGAGKAFHKLVTGPVSIVNFMNAIDKKGVSVLANTVRSYKRQVEKLKRLELKSVSKGRIVDEFDKSAKIIGEIHTAANRVKPWLWTAPAWQKHVSALVSVTDVISKMQGGAITFTAYRMAGFDDTQSLAFAAMRQALSVVPVLGSFYQEAIDMIPGVAIDFAALVKGYHARIARDMHSR